MARLFTTLVLLVLGFYTLYSMRSSTQPGDRVVEHDPVERRQVPQTQADDESSIALPRYRQLLVKNDNESDVRSQPAFDETRILSNYRECFEGKRFSAWVNDVKVAEETIGFSIADKTARSIFLG